MILDGCYEAQYFGCNICFEKRRNSSRRQVKLLFISSLHFILEIYCNYVSNAMNKDEGVD